jgi:hypothetical protein
MEFTIRNFIWALGNNVRYPIKYDVAVGATKLTTPREHLRWTTNVLKVRLTWRGSASGAPQVDQSNGGLPRSTPPQPFP